MLAVSVFLPWYGVSFTAAGIAIVQQAGDQIASQFGNGSLQSLMGAFHHQVGSLAGQQFTALSAHQALHVINIVLLVLAGLAMLDAILPLARAEVSLPAGAGGSVVVLGTLAAICVVYRMLHPPTPAGELVVLSLREGAWLALLGSLGGDPGRPVAARGELHHAQRRAGARRLGRALRLDPGRLAARRPGA